jgi:hypothetical protein
MERASIPDANGRKRSVAWLPEIDRILIVGMKHGPQGIRQATNRVLSLRAGLTRADCWKRLRSFRENGNGHHPPPRNWPDEIKELLREGYLEGGKKKRQAIKAVRDRYPGLPSNSPSRFARRQGWLARSTQACNRRPWTEHEERKLWELAGYETAAKIGDRLARSEEAIRFRLKALGLSVKVKDGWSFRALQEMLHVGPSKLRRFIADGSLRVRDPRISANSLVAILESRVVPTTENGLVEGAQPRIRKGQKAYSWGNAAKVLAADVEQVRRWIISGDLKIMDGFVTERAFQEFCEKHGSELNTALLGDGVRDWLVEGYSLNSAVGKNAASTPANEKHALMVRRCPGCLRQMRGNMFFGHLKKCKGMSTEGLAVA